MIRLSTQKKKLTVLCTTIKFSSRKNNYFWIHAYVFERLSVHLNSDSPKIIYFTAENYVAQTQTDFFFGFSKINSSYYLKNRQRFSFANFFFSNFSSIFTDERIFKKKFGWARNKKIAQIFLSILLLPHTAKWHWGEQKYIQTANLGEAPRIENQMQVELLLVDSRDSFFFSVYRNFVSGLDKADNEGGWDWSG